MSCPFGSIYHIHLTNTKGGKSNSVNAYSAEFQLKGRFYKKHCRAYKITKYEFSTVKLQPSMAEKDGAVVRVTMKYLNIAPEKI